MGLSWCQPTSAFKVTGDSQCHDGEQTAETGNKNHICMVIQLYTASAVLC